MDNCNCNIFLFVRSKDTCALQVYKVEVPDNNYEDNHLIANTYFNYTLSVKKLEIFSELNPSIHTSCSTFVCSGNYIYVLGGKLDWLKIEDMRPGLFVRDVYRLDITAASNGNVDWKLCGRMMVGRVRPGVVVYNNKFYIFGGTMRGQPYAEVYDLESGQSEELPNPTRHLLSTKVMFVENNGDPYVIASSLQRGYLMLYHISTKYWQFYHDCDSEVLNSGNPILVERNGEKIIYTYFNYKLHAYTLCSEYLFTAIIEGIDEGFMDRHLETPSLIHLQEDQFCLIYEDGELYGVGADKKDNVVIHVTIFNVHFRESKGIRNMEARACGNMNYIIEGNIIYEGVVESRC